MGYMQMLMVVFLSCCIYGIYCLFPVLTWYFLPGVNFMCVCGGGGDYVNYCPCVKFIEGGLVFLVLIYLS